MTVPGPRGWLLVQRADAPAADRDRVDGLADRLGPPATVRRTGGPEAVDDAIERLDGRVLVVCGGDGSLHLAVNRLAALARLADTTVALFPAGTGDDLAHTLALPRDPGAMADLLRTAPARSLDLLQVGDRGVAVNALHCGVGVQAAARRQELPDGLGALAYPLGALLAGIGADGFEGEVRVDGRTLRASATRTTLMVLVMNGRTLGGGHALAPDADPCDGLLDVVVCQATGVAARAAFGVAVTRGTHLDRDDVAAARGRTVQVAGHELAWNVDGELWTDQPVDVRTIEVRPGALTLVARPRPPTRRRAHPPVSRPPPGRAGTDDRTGPGSGRGTPP